VGLRRRDFSAGRIAAIREMHKLLYRQGKTLDEARAAIVALGAQDPEAQADATFMDSFLSTSASGIAR
jgi:UDP-N-acetylglucosamine acyltransferase